MSNTKHEDAIMKMGFRYFRDQILKMLGIDYNYVDSGPTELVELTIHSMFMDFTFLTVENFYIHVEFQTTDSGEDDLRRFHAYEAVFSHETRKKVLTYVIYSGGIKNTRDTLDCGAYLYKVFPVYLTQKNADKFLTGKDLEEIKEVVAMTRLGQMLYDDGLKVGKSEGRKEGSDRMAALTKVLLDANRVAELQLAVEDSEYREKLMEEYGIN